jgi:magnesium-transporting ATPase (P-type)
MKVTELGLNDEDVQTRRREFGFNIMPLEKSPGIFTIFVRQFLSPLIYVLLAAAQKYRKDLEEGSLSYFYEVLFHSLNLNTLAVDGNLFDFKMNPVWKEERILKIKDDLKKIYEDTNSETVEIFRNANFVFLSLLIEYMEAQQFFLENMEIFFVNPKIHQQKEVFIIVNCEGTNRYSIWKLTEDRKKDLVIRLKR